MTEWYIMLCNALSCLDYVQSEMWLVYETNISLDDSHAVDTEEYNNTLKGTSLLVGYFPCHACNDDPDFLIKIIENSDVLCFIRRDILMMLIPFRPRHV
ncbi:hypothetical protein O6P43_009606 [Quillaja saponaria]|uniref:Uncharacterized protein n=1 Tax=Quillaja saponaria TaxID=32244 RepID=A0AAD7PYP6_QUISA|nr:hypothetical protein O6P43_009606 [Quillaja saponaria]